MHEAVHYCRLASVPELVEPKSHVGNIAGCMVHYQDASAVYWPTYRSCEHKQYQEGEEDLSTKEAVTSAHGCGRLRSVGGCHLASEEKCSDLNISVTDPLVVSILF